MTLAQETKGEAKINEIMAYDKEHQYDISIEASEEARSWYDQITQDENKPWKGASMDGLTVGTSIDDLLNNPEWNFPVGKVALKDEEGFNCPDSWMATRREDTKQHLGIVSEKYNIVQTAEVTEKFRPFFESGVARFESCGVRGGGKQMWMMARMATKPLMALKDDPILPYLTFFFGHDGNTSIRIFPTAVRLFCMNAMPALKADAKEYGIKIKHRSGANDALEAVMEVTQQAYMGMKDVEEQLKLLANKKVVSRKSLEKYFRKAIHLPYRDPEQIFKDEEEYLKYISEGKRKLEALFEAYDQEASTLPPAAKDTWYHAVNAGTRYLTHGKGEQESGNNFCNVLFGSEHATQMNFMAEALEMAA